MLKQRKQDLTIDNFKLKHLEEEQAETLGNLLPNHYASFSRSIKKLGQEDKFSPNLKLINDYPMKTLYFPLPQSLHYEMKEQINQLLRANTWRKLF